MPRTKRVKELPIKPNKPFVSAVPEKTNTFTLGGREFEVAPISSRGTEEAYYESAEFLTSATPIITKIFSSITTAGFLVEGKNFKDMTGLEQISTMLDMSEDLGLTSMIGEIANVLPKLCAIACHNTDPDVTPSDVRRMAGTPLNPELLRSVVMQIRADNIISNLVELGVLFVGDQAAPESAETAEAAA